MSRQVDAQSHPHPPAPGEAGHGSSPMAYIPASRTAPLSKIHLAPPRAHAPIFAYIGHNYEYNFDDTDFKIRANRFAMFTIKDDADKLGWDMESMERAQPFTILC